MWWADSSAQGVCRRPQPCPIILWTMSPFPFARAPSHGPLRRASRPLRRWISPPNSRMRISKGTVTIRTWEHGTHQHQGRLKGNASVTSFSATSFGARWETTYADGEERTSALPPTAFGPSSPGKHKCLHKAYNGRC